MKKSDKSELIATAINGLTENVSAILLKEFVKLPSELQINLVLIKASQLLLANVLCQVAINKEELEKLAEDQGAEMKELIFNCALAGFIDKFGIKTH